MDKRNILKKSFCFDFCVFFPAILIFTLSFLPYGICDEPALSNTVPMSLAEAVNIAFANNKDIQIQEEEIKVAKANIMGAQSNFLPKVNLNASYTYNDAVLTIPQQIDPQTDKDLGIFTGYNNDNKIGITVNESIYNGGANIANFQQAKIRFKVQDETLRARKLDVEFEAKRLYYGLLLAYETERITQNLYNQAKAHYEDVLNKFNQGTASRFDALQSKVQVSKLMPELVKSRNAVLLIKADFKKLLGMKMQESIDLKDELACSFILIKEDDFLKQAYANKPEMILKLLGVDINQWSIQMARAEGRPQVEASAGYNFRSNSWGDMFNDRHSNWSAGVSVNVPIFDGFSTKAKVDAAKAKYSRSVLEKENINDQIAVDIRQACLDLKEAEAIIDSQRDSIDEAKEALKISEISYDNGVGTNLDILDAQVSLSQIEKNLSEGIYDYLMAKASLDRTMGQSVFSPVNKNSKVELNRMTILNSTGD